LLIALEKEAVPGVSYRFTAPGAWPVWVNRTHGWVCIGESTYSNPVIAVEFLRGCIAVLEKESLRAVWLHPEGLPPEAESHSREVSH
jgi:hypothetical protein